MKRRFFKVLIIGMFGLMLVFPKPVFKGASAGILLWFNIVLPTLLPFIILSNLLIGTNAASLIARITGPLFCRLFRVSGYGSYAVLTGFMCGYPMGSKVTADLLKGGYISREEGRYLLSFCNNTSPMFIISYVIWQNLKEESLTLPAILILTVSPCICSFLFRRYYHISGHPDGQGFQVPSPKATSAGVVDDSIMNGFVTITKVGGYIMLFSVLLALAELIPLHHPALALAALPSLEITNGIPMLCQSCSDPGLCFILTMGLTSFGGWCSVAQTRCMVQEAGLPIFPYIIEKLITAGVTSLLACGYIVLL